MVPNCELTGSNHPFKLVLNENAKILRIENDIQLSNRTLPSTLRQSWNYQADDKVDLVVENETTAHTDFPNVDISIHSAKKDDKFKNKHFSQDQTKTIVYSGIPLLKYDDENNIDLTESEKR